MSGTAPQSGRSRSKGLVRKFNIALAIAYVCSVALTAPAIYFFTKKEIYDRASEELNLLVDVVKSIQTYVAEDLRPHLSKQDIFYSPAISGIVATARFADHFKKKQPQYYIRNASDNPLNPANRASGLENDLLYRFRLERGITSVNQEGQIDGQAYLLSAAPKISNKKGCMRCHGDPEKAPGDVINRFGTENGYGYRLNDVVGVSIVGVPLQDVQVRAVERGIVVLGVLTLLFTLLFVTVNLLVRRLILTPIVDMTDTAIAVSQGDINRVMNTGKRQDEIGDLSQAFELMRRSLLAAMKRMRKRS